ncbi:DUF4907 domain-containing protein [Flavobacterium zepuense]|nr:DUF4907 domain-containing protein [Flavobacterium zepuense]
MTTKIKRKFTVIKRFGILAITLIAVVGCQKKAAALQSNVHRTGNGYGYSITVKNKILIKQDFIPGTEGNHAFCDSLDAEKVASSVLTKLKQKEMPTITPAELKVLKIKTKC